VSTEPRIERKAATEYAKKRDRIMAFIRSARELQPLLSGMGESYENGPEEHMVELTEVLQKHNRSLEMLIDLFNLDQSVPDDAKLINLLGIELSKIENAYRFPEGANQYIKNITATLTELTVRRHDLTEIQKDIAFDADIVACVKVSLFRASFEFSKLLEGLKANNEEKQQWQKWLHSTSVALGKDVAFNFDQHGTFRDRELLFRECLPMCTQIAVAEWKAQFIKNASEKVSSNNSSLEEVEPSEILNRMDELKALLKSKHMGYQNHKTTNIEWLYKQIGYAVFGICESFEFISFTKSETKILKSLVIDNIEEMCIRAWESASIKTVENIQSKLANMTPDEVTSWKKSEGANPMPFSNFKDALKTEWNENDSLISMVEIDENKLTGMTRKSLAKLWGFSDAFCRIKREFPL
jgi:hypothetical protein